MIMVSKAIKTIKISEKAHRLLCGYGRKNETFDEIIIRVMEKMKHETKNETNINNIR